MGARTHFPSIRVSGRMLIFATDLTNCSNMPAAAKPNWLLSPSIELRAGSSFSLLLFSSALCQSLNLILPPSHTHTHMHAHAQTHTGNAIRKWLTRKWEWVWVLMMARGGQDGSLSQPENLCGVCEAHRGDITELMALLLLTLFLCKSVSAAAQCQK